MKVKVLILLLLIGVYSAIMVPFTQNMRGRPFAEKLGHLPASDALQSLATDQKQAVGASLIMKVLMYFGGRVSSDDLKNKASVDYKAMSKTIHAALKLDPYNMDGYYFAQAVLVWDVGQYQVANDLLQYGMKYRTWDWYLPFFAGFNYAYFLKDYPNAARMYMRAGELSGDPLFKKLAGRYLQQSGQTEIAIAYLTTMEKGTRDKAVKESFRIRLTAFRRVLLIEKARDRFASERGRRPLSVEELIETGYLKAVPVDPYGGKFYLEPDGTVSTSSKFAFAGVKNQ